MHHRIKDQSFTYRNGFWRTGNRSWRRSSFACGRRVGRNDGTACASWSDVYRTKSYPWSIYIDARAALVLSFHPSIHSFTHPSVFRPMHFLLTYVPFFNRPYQKGGNLYSLESSKLLVLPAIFKVRPLFLTNRSIEKKI